MTEFVNKVADSGIITLNLENYFPAKDEVVVFDLKDYLFMGLILKEKDFRERIKTIDLDPYKNKIVALSCSADAVIPFWAYMLVTSLLQPIARKVIFGSDEQVRNQVLIDNIEALDVSAFKNERVVIKGCGELPVHESGYVAITEKLRPMARSIMYGEPCSTVPVFKKPLVKAV